MTTNRIFKRKNNNIFFAIVASVLLLSIFLLMMMGVYMQEEEECYENLHIQTKQFKDDFAGQLQSDSEALALVANLAGELYKTGQDMNLVFDSYEPTGFVSNVGILQPDDTFLTKKGVLNFNGILSFAEEVSKGEYISGRVADVTNKEIEIIRIAKPVMVNGQTVAILYGSINLDTLGKRYLDAVSDLNAQLFIYESGNGNFIIDTIASDLGNVELLKERKYDEGYSYEKLISEEKGYTVFKSAVWNEKLYMHYSPLEIADWKIMLARRETHVFAKARFILKIMYTSFLFVGIVLALYFLYLLKRENAKKHITSEGSQIRKLLLDINQQESNIKEALEKITKLSKARSAVYVDTDGEDYNFILPIYAERLLSGDERNYFISEILGYAAELRIARKKSVDVISIKANHQLLKSNPKFHDFLVNHEMNEIVFASVTDKNNHISVLCVLNPKKAEDAKILLADIAVCFSIAIYNKKHLNRTEIAATTDSLTGLLNRVTYKKDIEIFDEERCKNFACVYIDVNELHLMNNRYGHAAGDEMLIYIANTLKEVFYGHYIYRMGGDEYLVFIKNTDTDSVKNMIDQTVERLAPKNYHVAIGMSFRQQNTNTEDMVTDAEKRMYDAKAHYYQNKEAKSVSASDAEEYKVIKTGIGEIDALLTAMKYSYHGIYKVSLKTDEAHRILMPAYLGYNEKEISFSGIFTKYVENSANSDFHRALLNFLNYETLSAQLAEGNIPRITYKKANGEDVMLSVYPYAEQGEEVDLTLWVFEKM